MKKYILSAIALSLLSIQIAEAKQTLVVYEDEQKGIGIEKAARDFEKTCDCEVKIIDKMGISDQLGHIISLSSSGKYDELPDVFEIISDRVGEAIDKKLIAPLDKMKKDQGQYQIMSLLPFEVNGQLYSFPRSIESLIIFYNKDLLEYPFENLNDYLIYNQGRKKDGKYGLIGRLDQFYYGYSILSAYGAKIFGQYPNGNPNPYDLQLNKGDGAKGLDLIKDYIDKSLSEELLSDSYWSNAIKYLAEGKAAAIISGPWDLNAVAKTGMNFGVASLPNLPNGQKMHPFYGAKGYVVSSHSKNKELAQNFLSFINQPEYAYQRYSLIGELPPVNKLLNMEIIHNDDFATAISEQVKNADTMPTIKEMGYVWGPMSSAMFDAIKGRVSSKEALDNAVNEISSQIK